MMLLMMMFALASNKPMICRFTNSVPAAGGGGEGAELFSVTSSTKSDVDYLGRSTRGYLNGINGEATLQGPIEEVARIEAEEAEGLLKNLGILDPFSSRHSPRGIFCSHTLNFQSISCIGYDMDYTLVQYNVKAWEGRAYDYCMDNLRSMGFPIDGLAFDPDLMVNRLDDGVISADLGPLDYKGLYKAIYDAGC